jgi:hypothetical protein
MLRKNLRRDITLEGTVYFIIIALTPFEVIIGVLRGSCCAFNVILV